MTALTAEADTVPCGLCGEPVPSSWFVPACGYAPLPEALQIAGPMNLAEHGIRFEVWAAHHPWEEDARLIAALEPLPVPLPNAPELRACGDRAYARHKGVTVAELYGLPAAHESEPESVADDEPVPAAAQDDTPQPEDEPEDTAAGESGGEGETAVIDAVTETDEAA